MLELTYQGGRDALTTTEEHNMDNFDIDAENADVDISEEELDAFYAEEASAEEAYNLIPKATAECLSGDCDHFCGEPTQADLDRLERRGYGHLVEAYENNLVLI
jgi:hypothetical protein